MIILQLKVHCLMHLANHTKFYDILTQLLTNVSPDLSFITETWLG